jgi:hypothetical protein
VGDLVSLYPTLHLLIMHDLDPCLDLYELLGLPAEAADVPQVILEAPAFLHIL